MAKKLTSKQEKFVEVYDGNGTEAARLAGYEGNDNVLAQAARDNLRNPQITQAIKARETKQVSGAVATREERQRFWSEIMHNDEVEMRDRLRASELLGKSQADFTEKHEHSVDQKLEDLIAGSYAKKDDEE